MNDTTVLETRKVKDHIFRHRSDPKGRTFWSIEYEFCSDTPPAVRMARNLEKNQLRLRKQAEK
jgi:hypothetical protein